MKLAGIFRFELAYQVRRPWPWLISLALLVFSFLMTRDGSLAEALLDEFFINSPFAIAKTTVTLSLIWVLLGAAVAGDAAGRDVATRMHPLTYTTPTHKAEYLGGRFLAAFVLNALIQLAVQLGILLGVYLPGVDPVMIGPFRPAAYLTAYAYLALPNAFFATAIQFWLAARKGRPMAAYLGSLLLFFMAYVVTVLTLGQGRPDLARLLDPIGVQFILSDLSHLWTSIEKRTRLLELEGAVLSNRMLWVGVGLAALALTYLGFRFTHRTDRAPWWRRVARRRTAQSPLPAGPGVRAGTPIVVPEVPRRFGFGLHVRQVLSIAWDSFRTIAKSWPGLAMLVALPLMSVLVVADQMQLNGIRLVPTTARVVAQLTAPVAGGMSRWVIVPLLIVFFAGVLVWREREVRLGDMTDALPITEWVPFLGKFLGLAMVLALFLALLGAAGIFAQTAMGYHDYELGLYLTVLWGLQLPEYLLFALLAFVVHGLVDQKYVGHLAAIMAYVLILLAGMFGIEHDLLIYGAGPGWSYTEMRGFGPFLGPWLWFKLYWAAWALLLAVAARLMWVRGRESGWGRRMQMARRRLTRPTAWAAGVAVALIVSLGGFVFYNTNVLNDYLTDSDVAERAAEYERRYARYANVPQPRLTGTRLRVEIHPGRGHADVRGSYRLVNRGTAPIDSIHVAVVPGVETGPVTFDRPAAGVLMDRGHRIYDLRTPLQPGDSLRMDFSVRVGPRGFRESGVDAPVVANGTLFNNRDWLPAIGYQRGREVTSPADRRELGLPPRPLIASLYDDAQSRMDQGDRMAFEAVVGTDADETAVAPGVLRRTWTEGGRRYFHYASDVPIGGEHYFFSARYGVHEARWTDSAGTGRSVAIRIYHVPGHTANLERMVRSARASLDYYTREFGPYRYGHLSLVESPGIGTAVHAVPGMLIYEEGFSFWNPDDEAGGLDLPYAVVAHEVAHQWTVPYAFVEGAPVLSEGTAWYYSLKLLEHARGPRQLRLMLRYMRQPEPFPTIRRGEPLLRGLDPYLSYRKGPFALYALSEYIGDAPVNTALRRLVARHQPSNAPPATMLDLYRELRAVTPDSMRYLLHDLYEVTTVWEFDTDRVTAVQAADSTWRVTMEVRARKVRLDSAGVETVLPMNEWVEVGVFAPGGAEGALSKPLHLQMHRVRAGAQTITVTVPGRPALAGLDPRQLLDWEQREDGNNVVEVKTGG